MGTLLLKLETYSFDRVFASKRTNKFLNRLYRSRSHSLGGSTGWLCSRRSRIWLASIKFGLGSELEACTGSSSSAAYHESCDVDHRWCWETRASQLSHGCHAGFFALCFRCQIQHCTNMVIGIRQQYGQFPNAEWPGISVFCPRHNFK